MVAVAIPVAVRKEYAVIAAVVCVFKTFKAVAVIVVIKTVVTTIPTALRKIPTVTAVLLVSRFVAIKAMERCKQRPR